MTKRDVTISGRSNDDVVKKHSSSAIPILSESCNGANRWTKTSLSYNKIKWDIGRGRTGTEMNTRQLIYLTMS